MALTSNGADHSLLWHTAEWQPGASMPAAARGNVTTFALAPDGTAAIGTPQGVYLIEVATGKVLVTINADSSLGLTSGVAYSPDGNRLAVLNADAIVFLWDLPALRAELTKLGLDW